MINIEVICVSSFTNHGKGGNPAGVVFDADRLSSAQKLHIAQTVGYSETAFVSADHEADYEVSFFTTTGEIDFCGHATLAVFSMMFQKEMLSAGIYTQRTKAGILSVSIDSVGQVIMSQQMPQKLGRFSYQEIANIIGIESSVLASTQLPIEVVSTGLADLIIAVPLGYLDAIQPNDEVIAQFCKGHDLVGFHVFELCPIESEYTASCRNFAPLFGITEESATGSASGALACYLTEHLTLGSDYTFEQGRAMGCSSVISVSVTASIESVITSVKVGGFASQIGTLNINV